MSKTETPAFRIMMLVIALIGVGITVYVFWTQTRKNGNGFTLPPPVQCETNADCPSGQQCNQETHICEAIGGGTIQVWPFAVEPSVPTKKIMFELPHAAHVSTITGTLHVVNTCPSCWFVKAIGWRYYGIDNNNRKWTLGIFEPQYGVREGAYPISLAPGITLKRFYAEITRYYGFGEDKERFQAMTGDLIVQI